jgi:PilZ domain
MKKSDWFAATVAAGVGGALLYVFRCRHASTSFPITREGATYITCLKCGSHRLYDTGNMQGYGPWTATPRAALERATEAAIEAGEAPDRRATARVRKRTAVKARNLKNGQEDQEAETRDLSERGLFLFTKLPVQAASELELILVLPPEIAPDASGLVCCQGKVVRVEKSRNKGTGVAVAIERMERLPQI